MFRLLKAGGRRLLLITVPLCAILLLAHHTLRRPILDLEVSETFQAMAAAITDEDWEEAHTQLEQLQGKWKQARPRVLLNAGVDSLRDFESALARLDKMIRQGDKTGALAETATLGVLWIDFISF